MNEFKAKRTRYARVSSSYSEELSKTLHRVLQTALENQLRRPVPQPQSFDDSPTLEAPSLELCLRFCRRSHTPSFASPFRPILHLHLLDVSASVAVFWKMYLRCLNKLKE